MTENSGAKLAIAVQQKWDELIGPMLAHAWDEGRDAGPLDTNPYRESSWAKVDTGIRHGPYKDEWMVIDERCRMRRAGWKAYQ